MPSGPLHGLQQVFRAELNSKTEKGALGRIFREQTVIQVHFLVVLKVIKWVGKMGATAEVVEVLHQFSGNLLEILTGLLIMVEHVSIGNNFKLFISNGMPWHILYSTRNKFK